MSVELNHTIVRAHDKQETARHLVEILGLPEPTTFGPFVVVQVANGVSELLGEVFGDAGRHARSAVGVSVLPLDAPVEVELLVEVMRELGHHVARTQAPAFGREPLDQRRRRLQQAQVARQLLRVAR